MPAITILLANPHPIIRSSLRSLLERQPDFRIVAEAANGREALVLADYKRPDVVILDLNLPLLSGVEAAREIKALRTGSAIVFHTSHADEEYLSAAFNAGARGYVAADSASTELVRAIRVVTSGRLYISPAVSKSLLHSHSDGGAPADDDTVLCCLLAAGYEYFEILPCLSQTASPTDDYLRCAVERVVLPDVIAHSVRENQRQLRPL